MAMRLLLGFALVAAPTVFGLKAALTDEPRFEDIPIPEQPEISEQDEPVEVNLEEVVDEVPQVMKPEVDQKREESPTVEEEIVDTEEDIMEMRAAREKKDAPSTDELDPSELGEEVKIEMVKGGLGIGDVETGDEAVPDALREAEEQGADEDTVMMAPQRKRSKEDAEEQLREEYERMREEDELKEAEELNAPQGEVVSGKEYGYDEETGEEYELEKTYQGADDDEKFSLEPQEEEEDEEVFREPYVEDGSAELTPEQR